MRFQPAKPSLRAFTHSLAADWGFVTESFDPEPHRHVFVLKPASWNPPVFGLGNGTAIGIGGMSVGECVKLRERQRMKEREAQRITAAEAKVSREAAKAQAQANASDGGWAQVAASRKSNTNAPVPYSVQRTPFSSESMYAALAAGDDLNTKAGAGTGAGAKKERLVLRSGVGSGKHLQSQRQQPVADSWEEEEEKEEEQERKLDGVNGDGQDSTDGRADGDASHERAGAGADTEQDHGTEGAS